MRPSPRSHARLIGGAAGPQKGSALSAPGPLCLHVDLWMGHVAVPVSPSQLFRLSGAAAMAGGVLRMAAALPVVHDPIALEWLYTMIDVLLLFGVIGIYLVRAQRLGFLGLASFGVAVAALSFIGGPDADPFGFSTYQEGAAALAIAMVGLSIAWLRVRERPISAPLCWFGSVVIAGVLALLPAPLSGQGIAAAGILFGAGFVLAGLHLVRGDGSAQRAAGKPPVGR